MLALGFSAGEIAALEQSAVGRFSELNAVFGPGGEYVTNNDPAYDPNTFDPAFNYQLTQQQQVDLISPVAFTEDSLLWNLSTGVLNRTDTTAFDESPNIIADTITLTASDTIGERLRTGQAKSR